MRLEVDTSARRLIAAELAFPCAIGRGGVVAASEKREGDGTTPLGEWAIRGALLRPDRNTPVPPRLPWRWLRPDDGWSDDPADPAYNRAVRRPRAFSAERLWRDDALYDVVVVLGHNDQPPQAGLGSAIFLHIWRDGAATEGCVAMLREALLTLLPRLTARDTILIR